MPASASPSRRFLQPRFSLRALLVAVTAFAIGFPIWYRWPYEESTDPFAPSMNVVTGPASKQTLVTTWQRQWGGKRRRHGLERLYMKGKLEMQTSYRNGQRHGPYAGGDEVGQFANGEKEGVWKSRDPRGNVISSATWRSGRLNGVAEFFQDQEGNRSHPRTLLFSVGRLMSVDGQPVDDLLDKLIAEEKIDFRQIEVARKLASETRVDVIQVPLQDFANFLSVQHNIPIVLDPHHADKQRAITGEWRGISLSSVLTIVTSEHGHGCDYRYGLLWITSAEDARDWRDPTGVADIEPPKDSQLANSWNAPVDVDANQQPLAAELTKLAQSLTIDLDTSAIEAADEANNKLLVTLALRGHTFRHVLGMLLYRNRCRAELHGETLVILPP